jgi:hypothetical protein
VIDENVTTEFPWINVNKELIMDNLDLHSESSDFLPIMDKIKSNSDQQILLSYAPTALDHNDFYVCLTPESRAVALKYIENHRLVQQQLVISTVEKIPKPWEHLGSADVIRESFVKKSRPLYEIEVSLGDCLHYHVFLPSASRSIINFFNEFSRFLVMRGKIISYKHIFNFYIEQCINKYSIKILTTTTTTTTTTITTTTIIIMIMIIITVKWVILVVEKSRICRAQSNSKRICIRFIASLICT